MIITIQPLKKGYEIIATETCTYPDYDQYEITARADLFANLAFLQTGERPTIKILPIQHTPMATKKTYPAKKKAVVAKKKKVVNKKK